MNPSTPPSTAGGEEEGWLTSYLDVLTLLLTLFVLLLEIIPRGQGDDATATEVAASAASAGAVIQPRHEGLNPRLANLDIPGVHVIQGQRGVTLRIDDNLLFPSGWATLID